MTTWTCTIPLAPVSMKNSRRIAYVKSKGGTTRTMVIKSKDAAHFAETALLYVKASGRGPKFTEDDKLRLTCAVRYPNYLRDLDIELVKDVLQDAGVIPNDRQIREVHAVADDQVGDPATVITLERIGIVPWRKRT